MRLIFFLAVQGVFLTIVDTAVISVKFKLFCLIQQDGRLLRKDHRLWAHALLMDRDDWTADDILVQCQSRNRDDSPEMRFVLSSKGADDGLFDNCLEVYLDIKHNCIWNHKNETRTKTIEVGAFRIDKPEPTLKNLGTIYLP